MDKRLASAALFAAVMLPLFGQELTSTPDKTMGLENVPMPERNRWKARMIAPVDFRNAPAEDVMLTGFADLSVASLMTPSLTTVHQDREQMAQAAFWRLMERIERPSLPPCDIFLPSQLVVRTSTERSRTK